MALYILSASALMIMTGVKLSFSLCIEAHTARLCVKAKLLFGLLKIKGNALICWMPLTIYVNGKPHLLPKRKQKTKLPMYIWDGTEISELKSHIVLGIKDDGAATVILTGIVREIVHNMMLLAEADNILIETKPVFDHDEFCLQLEGIASIHPTQIIYAVIKRKISKMRKEKKYDASC